MIKLGCGGALLAFAALLILWTIQNLFIERQPEFNPGLRGYACSGSFICALIFVGLKWVSEGRQALGEMLPRKSRRKKKRRPTIDYDDVAPPSTKKNRHMG